MPESVFCQRHPDTPTNLRCGRCEATICPDCMVYAPVGARCQDCAKTAPLPMFDIGNAELAKAIAVSLAIGIGGGILVGFLGYFFVGIAVFILIDLFELAAFAGLGLFMGTTVGKALRGKRGRLLQYVAVGGMIAACFAFLFTYGTISLSTLIGTAAGGYLAASRLRI